MSEQVPVFHLRLGADRSIGPVVLRRIWSTASELEDVSVARTLYPMGRERQEYLYALCGPARTGNLDVIESRLRQLLGDAIAGASVTLTRTG